MPTHRGQNMTLKISGSEEEGGKSIDTKEENNTLTFVSSLVWPGLTKGATTQFCPR